ncbi:15692_t:CDS:2, partial [Racocetra fulgida]
TYLSFFAKFRLEFKLEKVLGIAYTWNAILLLDEVDIYLERRSTSDINQIWTNLSNRAKLNFKITAQILDKKLNGRAIRNVLHIARMFAESEEEDLTSEHVITIIDNYKKDLDQLGIAP